MRLRAVLDEHSLVCGAVLAHNGTILERVGNFDDMMWAPSLLGPQALPLLDRLIRPAMLEHGREFALLERVGDVVVLVFGLDRAQGMDHILFARQVAASIQQAFGEA